jgi:hypothetical protein
MSGRSFTRVFGRGRGIVYAWSFFGDVRFEWVDLDGRRGNAGEGEGVGGCDDVGLSEDRVGERDVQAERLPLGLARQGS